MDLILALAAAAHPPVVLSAQSTADFVEQCRGADADMTGNFCTGYIVGVEDALALSRVICPPPNGPTTLQAVAITRKFINDHPEKWNEHPASLVRQALRPAFPCSSR